MKGHFDIVAISAKLHSGKDDCRIFQYVLDSLNVAAEMGMRTILFDDESRDFDTFVQNLNAILQEKI